MASVCGTIKNIIKPPEESESEICESALQPQNFVDLDDYGLDSPKGSIQSKSSGEEEEKTEMKKKKKKEESKQRKEKVK